MRLSIFVLLLLLVPTASAFEDTQISTPSQWALDDVYNLISDSIERISNYMSDLLDGLIDTILYPFKLVISICVNIYNQIAQAISAFISAITSVMQNLYMLVYSGLAILLPAQYIPLVMIVIPIIVVLRIYFLLRGSK